MPTDQPITPKHRLRWYQFSLRTLLIFVTLFACACSWFAVKKQQANRQKEAVQALERHGYHITYDYEHYGISRNYYVPTPAPDWIVKLVGKDFLYDVYGVGATISLPIMQFHMPALTDADMTVFEQLPRLRTLRFRNKYGNPAKITDKGLAHLQKLKYLEDLELIDTLVTEAGVQ